MIKTLKETFGRYTVKYKRTYYWDVTDSTLLTVAEAMRDELNKNGYNLDLKSGIICVTRRRSVFVHIIDGYLSGTIFKEREALEKYLDKFEHNNIVEVTVR